MVMKRSERTMSDRDSEDESRVLMRSWLINQLNNDCISGLQWHDKSKTHFRVPWVHGSRRGWTNTDGEVFMKWALHTGKFVRERDQPDHKKWKANFRCAINSLPDVVEVKDLSDKKGPKAYRIYKMKTEKARRSKCRRFTGLHVGKGNKPKKSKISRQKAVLQNNFTTRSQMDDNWESHETRVPVIASPASYSDGTYSPACASSPSSTTSTDCTTSSVQQEELDTTYNHPTYLDDHHYNTLGSPDYDTPPEMESEYTIGPGDMVEIEQLPDINTIFANLSSKDLDDEMQQYSIFSVPQYTELSSVKPPAKFYQEQLQPLQV